MQFFAHANRRIFLHHCGAWSEFRSHKRTTLSHYGSGEHCHHIHSSLFHSFCTTGLLLHRTFSPRNVAGAHGRQNSCSRKRCNSHQRPHHPFNFFRQGRSKQWFNAQCHSPNKAQSSFDFGKICASLWQNCFNTNRGLHHFVGHHHRTFLFGLSPSPAPNPSHTLHWQCHHRHRHSLCTFSPTSSHCGAQKSQPECSETQEIFSGGSLVWSSFLSSLVAGHLFGVLCFAISVASRMVHPPPPRLCHYASSGQ